ncbi:hypothetical protein [Pyxidicoccus parkwayensis]|uniref:hypothetical protein n=1 Tax=Pyxidicoccus parkwayensis TaxID=2813578 RepID=UPI001F51274D|nr:hypothetical protein [Pyxidicoccus parkwaysis]
MENNFGTPMSPGAGNAREEVSLPAILLMVISALGVLIALTSFFTPALMNTLINNPSLPADLRDQLAAQQGGASWVRSLPLLILSAVTFFGALQMKNLRNYGMSLAAAIIACIPCVGSCCCIGIPVGIWAIIVLRRPHVRAAFT